MRGIRSSTSAVRSRYTGFLRAYFTRTCSTSSAPGRWSILSQLAAEIAGLGDAGIDTNRLLISERAHVIMPYHRLLDRLDDCRRPSNLTVGSTGCGVGFAYSDKAARIGIRAGDFRDRTRLRSLIDVALDRNNALLKAQFGHPSLTVDEVLGAIMPALSTLASRIVDTSGPVESALADDRRILLEGQLGVMRDLDWGAYPFVTSSCPTPAGLASGAGIPPQRVTRSIGVMKAYTTSVGDGPLPTELDADESERLRSMGGEFGATTGRPRRCGWLDLVAAQWACTVAGFTEVALTKLDILDTLAEIPVCMGYTRNGSPISASAASFDWIDVDPTYEMMPGWLTSTTGARHAGDLPVNARAYVDFCAHAVGHPIAMIGVGRQREAIVTSER